MRESLAGFPGVSLQSCLLQPCAPSPHHSGSPHQTADRGKVTAPPSSGLVPGEGAAHSRCSTYVANIASAYPGSSKPEQSWGDEGCNELGTSLCPILAFPGRKSRARGGMRPHPRSHGRKWQSEGWTLSLLTSIPGVHNET